MLGCPAVLAPEVAGVAAAAWASAEGVAVPRTVRPVVAAPVMGQVVALLAAQAGAAVPQSWPQAATSLSSNLSGLPASPGNGQVAITYDPSTDSCPTTPAAAVTVTPEFTG